MLVGAVLEEKGLLGEAELAVSSWHTLGVTG